jgi:hypothetical protein
VKYLIATLTILLLLLGLLTMIGSIFSGISFWSTALTFSTLIGIIFYFSDKKRGLTIILIISIAWLFRYFERSSFLLLYDPQNFDRWTLVLPIILVSTPLFFFSHIYRQRLSNKTVSIKRLALLFLLIPSLALLSFTRKAHTNEFNCWYYFDPTNSSYKITFAITPEHLFEGYSSSKELKDFIQKNGIQDQYREGFYCPETKVRVIKRFKEIKSISVVGFHNTTTNNHFNLSDPIDIDLNQINGDKSILEPNFKL